MKEKKDKRIRTSTAKMILAGAVLSVFLFTFMYTRAVGKRQQNIEAQATADVFTTMSLKDYEGNTVTSELFSHSKITVVNVWETTCTACIAEFPEMEVVTQEIDPEEVQIIGICADLIDKNGDISPELTAEAKEILDMSGATFLQLYPDEKTRDFIRANVSGFPTNFFVDSSGAIIDYRAGSRNRDGWHEMINEFLEKVE